MKTLRYCPISKLADASRLGWHIVGPMPAHHGVYSFLVEWLCPCVAPWPKDGLSCFTAFVSERAFDAISDHAKSGRL
jgi:hypothetical protein